MGVPVCPPSLGRGCCIISPSLGQAVECLTQVAVPVHAGQLRSTNTGDTLHQRFGHKQGASSPAKDCPSGGHRHQRTQMLASTIQHPQRHAAHPQEHIYPTCDEGWKLQGFHECRLHAPGPTLRLGNSALELMKNTTANQLCCGADVLGCQGIEFEKSKVHLPSLTLHKAQEQGPMTLVDGNDAFMEHRQHCDATNAQRSQVESMRWLLVLAKDRREGGAADEDGNIMSGVLQQPLQHRNMPIDKTAGEALSRLQKPKGIPTLRLPCSVTGGECRRELVNKPGNMLLGETDH